MVLMRSKHIAAKVMSERKEEMDALKDAALG